MLCTFHDERLSSLLTSWKSSARRVARAGAHIHLAWDLADDRSPQNARRRSLGSAWAALCAMLIFPICRFDPIVTRMCE